MKKTIVYSLLFVLMIGVATAQSQSIFYVANGGQVTQGQCTPTTFTLTESTFIGTITDYHYNYGSGSVAGTIGLIDQDNVTYGPWAAYNTAGFLYWNVDPNMTFPAGTYTVQDSQMSTWSYNSGTGNMCMSWGVGYPNELPPADVPEFGLIAGAATAAGALGIFLYRIRK